MKDTIIKTYNVYARDYNRAESHVKYKNWLSVEHTREIRKEMDSIRERMAEHGFEPEALQLIAKVNQGNDKKKQEAVKRSIQAWADHFNYSKTEGENVLKRLFEKGAEYEATEANLKIVNYLIQTIDKQGYPDKISLWDELSEQEKTKAGNPHFKDNKIKVPDGFYDYLQELKEEHPDRPLNFYNRKLRERFFNGDDSKESTVYRWIKEK